MYTKKYKGLLHNNQGPTLLIALHNQCTGEALDCYEADLCIF